jgi:hypothetical protein
VGEQRHLVRCIEALALGNRLRRIAGPPWPRPHVIADDGDEVVEHQHLPYAGNPLRLGVVHMCDLAAEVWAGSGGGELDAELHRVNAEHRLAVDFVRPHRGASALQGLLIVLKSPSAFNDGSFGGTSWLAPPIKSP